MKYLVDIDWVIDALANIPAAITPLRQLAHDGIAVSMISFGELYDGAYGSRVPLTEIARIQQFLSSYPVINLSDAIMDRFAQTRTLLRSQGMLIPNMDILIRTCPQSDALDAKRPAFPAHPRIGAVSAIKDVCAQRR